MKRAKLKQILEKKFRLKLTTRRRGRFQVRVPILSVVRTELHDCPTRAEALAHLHARMRCIEPIVFEVHGRARR